MNKFITLILILFLNYSLEAGEVIFKETTDEFTDEKEMFIGLSGDEHTSIIEEMIGIYCNPKLAMGIKKGIMFSMENRLKVTLRFDSNEAYKETFYYSNNLVITDEKRIISRFLENLSGSKRLLVKIEDIEGVMRFTNLENTKESVENFYASAPSIPQCNL